MSLQLYILGNTWKIFERTFLLSLCRHAGRGILFYFIVVLNAFRIGIYFNVETFLALTGMDLDPCRSCSDLNARSWRNLIVFINLLTGILTNANAPTRNINNSWINLCSCEQLHIKRAPTKVKFGHKNASDEEEIQSVLDESLESLSFIRICCCCYVLCVVWLKWIQMDMRKDPLLMVYILIFRHCH